MDRQLSLLERHRLTRSGVSDARHVVELARDVIAELDVEPPIPLEIVASFLDIDAVEVADIDVAGCLVCAPDRRTIKVRAQDARVRQRFTTCHECGHTFFPGFARTTQYRCQPGQIPGTDRDLETLCDLAASELLLPAVHFVPDARSLPFEWSSVEELADRYEASLEATSHRYISHADGPTLLIVGEVMTKPSEATDPAAVPVLRVRTARGTGDWPYVPPHKSIPDDSPLHSALEGEIVHETTTLEGFTRTPLRDVEVIAKLFPYGRSTTRHRVLAMVRPAGTVATR